MLQIQTDYSETYLALGFQGHYLLSLLNLFTFLFSFSKILHSHSFTHQALLIIIHIHAKNSTHQMPYPSRYSAQRNSHVGAIFNPIPQLGATASSAP